MIAMIRDLGHNCLDSSAIPPRMQDIDVLKMAAADQELFSLRTKILVNWCSFTRLAAWVLFSSVSRWQMNPSGYPICDPYGL
jgi:hypothetical protein